MSRGCEHEPEQRGLLVGQTNVGAADDPLGHRLDVGAGVVGGQIEVVW
jgi:hypothetical protein